MGDSEDDSSGIEEFSGLEQPPLVRQLKGILDQYPNNGQIIKELVQNAEDAGAREMKILWDQRDHSPERGKKKYNKFFQGPALCFYNDAEFNDNDWKGIKMIQCSVKEDDPLKVGRFGLGFKSVFHLTDYPCIMSGSKILLINPHEKNPGKVCVTIRLKKLKDCKRLDIRSCLAALDGTCGFSQQILDTGHFPGTLFWFPLRKVASELSETIYGNEIETLFQSFQHDAQNNLLFLNHLEKVDLLKRSEEAISKVFTVQIEGDLEQVRQKRGDFTASLNRIGGRLAENSVQYVTELTIRSCEYRANRKFEEQFDWILVCFYMGGQMSPKLQSLISDKSLAYSPCVGVALPLYQQDSEFKGHIFCFLPLPIPDDQGTESLTKLPVHVNGFFALNQNRSQLKWPTADQTMADKSMDWNKCLVNEVLPEAYRLLLASIIQLSEKKGNPKPLREALYRCIPDTTQVTEKWKLLVEALLPKLVTTPFLFTENKGGVWIQPNQAIFVPTEGLGVSTEIQTVKTVLQTYSQNLVEMPDHVLTLSRDHGSATEMTPEKFGNILRSDHAQYQSLSPSNKKDILRFLLHNQQIGCIDNLELLPCFDGSFRVFDSSAMPLFLAIAEEIALLPGLESKLCCRDTLPLELQGSQDLYQLRDLTLEAFANLLQETLEKRHGVARPVKVNIDSLEGELYWLSRVWKYILVRFPESLSRFKHLPLMPVHKSNTLELHSLTDAMVLKETLGSRLSDGVCQVLEALDVTIVPPLPQWMRYEDVQEYVSCPSEEAVLQLICRSPTNAIQQLSCTSEADRSEFVQYLGHCQPSSFSSECTRMLQKMPIFRKQSDARETSTWTSLSELNEMLLSAEYPVKYPRPFLVYSLEQEIALAKILGVSLVQESDLVLETLHVLQSDAFYSPTEKVTFMKWLLMRIARQEYRSEILSAAREIAFLNCGGVLLKPCDLFDPTDDTTKQLFIEECKFPEDQHFLTEQLIGCLRQLGLRTANDVSSDELLRTAQTLDQMSKNGRKDKSVINKATTFLEVLEKHSSIPSGLGQLQCILPLQERDRGFPKSLPWYQSEFPLCAFADVTSTEYASLVGSVCPVVEARACPRVAETFRWTCKPKLTLVLKNLQVLISRFTNANSTDILHIVAEIYEDLSVRPFHEAKAAIEKVFSGEEVSWNIVWSGKGFVSPKRIFIENEILTADLQPYLFKLPTEFCKFTDFFTDLGCYPELDTDVLLTVLKKLQEMNGTTRAPFEVKRDLGLVIAILNHIRDHMDELEDREDEILVPVHTVRTDQLHLKPASQLTYCNAQWLKDFDEDQDQGLMYVHADVTNSTAETLGVQSETQRLLSDEEPFEEWGQEEPLTTRLKNLLKESYVDGLAVPKEIFQNADDAGATEVRFLYDERENLSARTKLLDDGMAECQGPAIWAFNNANFSEKDFQNLRQLNAAMKQDDSSKVGKFGLGFCAVYNLTDVPSIISGNSVVIFDPHTTHLGKALPGCRPGLKMNLKNKAVVKRLKNQFQPYHKVFGCDMENAATFDGTLFRFPLRTPTQATKSDIAENAYTRDDCMKLLQMFMEAAGNLLLFSQNVKSIQLYHLPAKVESPTQANLVFQVTRTTETLCHGISNTDCMLKTATQLKHEEKLAHAPLREAKKTRIRLRKENDGKLSQESIITETSWIVFWATGTSSAALEMTKASKGRVPLGTAAIRVEENHGETRPVPLDQAPYGFYKKGHLFTFLPMPIQTCLPVHINGVFAITSDRRSLMVRNEDDKVSDNNWNEVLLKDAVCTAYLNLLEVLRDCQLSKEYVFHEFWPLAIDKNFLTLKESFYRGIETQSWKVFERDGRWVPIDNCVFLDPELRDNSQVGNTAFKLLSQFAAENSIVVDLPSEKMKEFEDAGSDCVAKRTVTTAQFIVDYFLPQISTTFWDESNMGIRDAMLVIAIGKEDSKVDMALRDTFCVPTQPSGDLKRPRDLVHPSCSVSVLFSKDDGCFPKGDLSTFKDPKILGKLVTLGMMTTDLTPAFIVDRAESIQRLANSCQQCSLDRCRHFIYYLKSKGFAQLNGDQLTHLQGIRFLPVKEKGENWKWVWKGDTLATDQVVEDISSCSQDDKHTQIGKVTFAQPQELYFQDCCDLVSCTQCVLDEDRIGALGHIDVLASVCRTLGVKDRETVAITTVLSQLEQIAVVPVTDQIDKNLLIQVTSVIYKDLSTRPFQEVKSTFQQCFSKDEQQQIVWTGHGFVSPTITFVKGPAFTIDLQPYLYQLPRDLLKYTEFFTGLGCHPEITVDVLLSVLKRVHAVHKATNGPLAVKRDLSMVVAILSQIQESIGELEGQEAEILLPVHTIDSNQLRLRPAQELTYCDAQWLKDFEEDENETLEYVHELVSNWTASQLGVKSLTNLLLVDAEAFEEWGQHESLTTRLKNLLKESYVDGLSVPKELIQNADDAGATEICFLYDERENLSARTKLLDDGMAECQGPAIWAFNNSVFSDKDLENIQKLNAATKEDDSSKIGKFGLGFCAVYNLTDVPSFITGENVVIFDPHTTHLGKALRGNRPGLKINLSKIKNQIMVKRLKNQFQPFRNVFGCDIERNASFDGTLFRFPLRTTAQAARSNIADRPYTKHDCLKLLKMFMEAAGNMLLFSQNVKRIQLYHLTGDAKNPEDANLVYTVQKTAKMLRPNAFGMDCMLQAATNLKASNSLRDGPLREAQKVDISVNLQQDGELSSEPCATQTSWIVYWATGTSSSALAMTSTNKGAVPLGSVAIRVEENDENLSPVTLANAPYGFYNKGHLFTFLPLPIQTALPVHINGVFAVTSDRRKLVANTEDDARDNNRWNTVLLEDAVCMAYILLLDILKENRLSSEYVFHDFWPLHVESDYSCLRQTFYKSVGEQPWNVFERDGKWVNIEQCIFLDMKLRMNVDIGNTAFEILSQFCGADNAVVIDLPKENMEQFAYAGSDCITKRTVSEETFIVKYFLPNIKSSFWTETNGMNLDKIVMFAITLDNPNVNEALKNTPCIRTDALGDLKRPGELVHPSGSLSLLFSKQDNRFPAKSFCSSPNILQHLVGLGMMNKELTPALIIDRGRSVESLAQSCQVCALERCRNVVRYLHGGGIRQLKEEDKTTLQQVPFLPVLEKTDNWKWQWKADCLPYDQEETKGSHTCKHEQCSVSTKFARPLQMYLETWKDLVSCTEIVLDEQKIGKSFFDNYKQLYQALGVKGIDISDIKLDTVCTQLECIAATKTVASCDRKLVEDVTDKLYSHLNSVCKAKTATEGDPLVAIQGKEILFVEGQYVRPQMVAFHLNHDCAPDFFRAGPRLSRYEVFLRQLSVTDSFDPRSFVVVLEEKKTAFQDQVLPEQYLHQICRMLEALADCMEEQKTTYEDIGRDIFAPDQNGVLKSTKNMCFDDFCDLEDSNTLLLIHQKISRKTAKCLGVVTKTRKFLKENSEKLSFGQREKLVTRLKGLLDEYPCDSGIVKELLQNADDAQATEIHFIKDYRNHSTDTVFDENFAALQGPSLCVFNNSAFSQKDLQGIQNLGIGSKSEDPSKTGQYGVGFNAVYNLTDAPSFLTKGPEIENNETLCFFDPTCNYLPDVSDYDPGVRYLDLGKLRRSHADVFAGYHEDVFNKWEKGTMFRLPLRTTGSPISHHIISPERMDKILQTFEAEMVNMLLFIKNVKKITISNITSGTLVEEYAVEMSMSNEDKIKTAEFLDYHQVVSGQFQTERKHALNFEFKELACDKVIKDSKGYSKTWHVVQRIGFEDKGKVPDVVKDSLEKGMLGLLPQGGVAAPLASVSEAGAFTSLAFCLLPLPVRTGLPVHVNGHFALDNEARRSLWKDSNMENPSLKMQWNISLLECVIAPAYQTLLEAMKKLLFSDIGMGSWPREIVCQRKQQFEFWFPKQSTAADDYWKVLAKCVYQRIVETEGEMFPIEWKSSEFNKNSHKRKLFSSVCWTPFQKGTLHFPAYIFEEPMSGDLTCLLQDLGLRVVSSSAIIQVSMSEAGHPFGIICPESVREFLQSYRSDYLDKCQIGTHMLGFPVNERGLKNVQLLLRYCCSDGVSDEKINNLPLRLTNDGKLNSFSGTDSVYLTGYCDLFPASGSLFLHKQLCSVFANTNDIFSVAGRHFKRLSFQSVLKFLLEKFDSSKFGAGHVCTWDPDNNLIPNRNWLFHLWKFVWEDAMQTSESNLNEKAQTHEAHPPRSQIEKQAFDIFKQHAQELGRWSLIPSLMDGSAVLLPVSNLYRLLNSNSFVHSQPLTAAMRKMKIPDLDTSKLTASKFSTVSMFERNDPASALKRLVPSCSTPVDVLTCLLSHKENMTKVSLDEHECVIILKYFSSLVKEKTDAEEWWIRDSLKALPLFVTQTGQRLALDKGVNVVVLPEDMPNNGMEEWASKTGIILLKDNSNLTELYQFLQFPVTAVIDLYIQFILKSFKDIPADAFDAHLAFIRDRLLLKSISQDYSGNQLKLIEALKQVPFLLVKGQRKRCLDLFNPDHSLFTTLCEDDEFPPNKFRTKEWVPFFGLLGMTMECTGALYIRFAEKIARESRQGISKQTALMSKKLVSYLMKEQRQADKHLVSNSDLNRIADIKFLVPGMADANFRTLFKQSGTEEQMICFSESAVEEAICLCWTSMPLLPEDADPCIMSVHGERKWLSTGLCIQRQPPLDKVLLHCQNIGDELQSKLPMYKEENRNMTWIEQMYDKIYKYLGQRFEDRCRVRLQYTPIVYSPNDRLICPASHIILRCSEEEEIKPYLMQLPALCGPFNDLFLKLGSAEKPHMGHYVRVLDILKGETKDGDILPPHKKLVEKAVRNLCLHLKSIKAEHPTQVEQLYLPTVDGKLLPSTEVVVLLKMTYWKRLKSRPGLNLLAEFASLTTEEIIQAFSKLPTNVKPRMLDEAIEERVNSDTLGKSQNDSTVMIESFLRGSDFVNCLLSFVKHEQKLTKQVEEKIVAQFRNVTVYEAHCLETFLVLDGEVIDGRSKRRIFHASKSIQNATVLRTILFQQNKASGKELFHSLEPHLCKFVMQCLRDAGVQLKQTTYVQSLMQCLKTPQSIQVMLDELEIEPFRSMVYTFIPVCGDYVQSKYHPFLDNEFSVFEEYEFDIIAYEIDDPIFDEEDTELDPKYIYVRIIEKMDLADTNMPEMFRLYKIDTGTEHLIVPAYKLYRFLGKKTTITTVQLSDNIPVPKYAVSKPQAMIQKEIRKYLDAAWQGQDEERRHGILKRLYMRWHPDRNPDHFELCSDVFAYIRRCVARLEAGQELETEDEMDDSSGGDKQYPDFSASQYGQVFNRLDNRSQAHRTACNRHGGRVNLPHREPESERQPCPDERRGRRWQKQAQADLNDAGLSLSCDMEPAFNWVCYRCHQAVEKSLKAAWYFRDANRLSGTHGRMGLSHDIELIARGLDENFLKLARQLSAITGEHARMRYPDLDGSNTIPALAYSREDADKAYRIAKELLDAVSEAHDS